MSNTPKFSIGALAASLRNSQVRTRDSIKSQMFAENIRSQSSNKKRKGNTKKSVFDLSMALEERIRSHQGIPLVRLRTYQIETAQELNKIYQQLNSLSTVQGLKAVSDPRNRSMSFGNNRTKVKRYFPKPTDFFAQLKKDCGTSAFNQTEAIINGTPDTPYFVAIKTPVIYPKAGLPLGFSFDPTINLFRIFFVTTGDVMFSFVYDSPVEAMKGRAIHLEMLDWGANLASISDQYETWYQVPGVYSAVFRELHKLRFGHYPELELQNPGITSGMEVMAHEYPDWIDQRHIRNLMLSALGDLGGIMENSDITFDVHNTIANNQSKISCSGIRANPLVLNKSQWKKLPEKHPNKDIQKIISKSMSDFGTYRIEALKKLQSQAKRKK